MTARNGLIDSLGEFLAHALELEHESAARYEQLADSMEIHHNQDVAQLFRRLAAMSIEHAKAVEQRTQGIELPHIPPWDFKWNCPGSPESDCLEIEVTYLMTRGQALQLAWHNESRGHAFYAHVAADCTDAEVRRLADEMAVEEAEHVNLLKNWLARERDVNGAGHEDLDPPNVPA